MCKLFFDSMQFDAKKISITKDKIVFVTPSIEVKEFARENTELMVFGGIEYLEDLFIGDKRRTVLDVTVSCTVKETDDRNEIYCKPLEMKK